VDLTGVALASRTGFDFREARTGPLSPGAQTRPLHLSKALRYIRARVTRVIDDDRNQKRYAVGHVGCAILALFNLAVDSKLRACDLTTARVRDVCHGQIPVIQPTRMLATKQPFAACGRLTASSGKSNGSARNAQVSLQIFGTGYRHFRRPINS
jgi:hypothetical protein